MTNLPPIGTGGSAPRRPRTTGKRSGARGDYASSRWARESREFLRRHPICACGCGERSSIVDHIEPVRPAGDPRFWDPTNWSPMAHRCHRRKSRREQGERGILPPVNKPAVIGCDVRGYPLSPDHPWNKGGP